MKADLLKRTIALIKDIEWNERNRDCPFCGENYFWGHKHNCAYPLVLSALEAEVKRMEEPARLRKMCIHQWDCASYFPDDGKESPDA